MPRIVRGALIQATWTGDKESMIQKHEQYAHEAATAGRPGDALPGALLRALLLPGAGSEYYSYTEKIPDGPTTKRMQDLAKQTGMVLVVPMYEEDEHAAGHLLQHGRRHRCRRQVPRQVPQDAHPARQGFLGEVLLPSRQPGLSRSSRRPSARSASTSATTATSPRAPARWASTAPRWSSSPRPPHAVCPNTCGASSRSRTR